MMDCQREPTCYAFVGLAQVTLMNVLALTILLAARWLVVMKCIQKCIQLRCVYYRKVTRPVSSWIERCAHRKVMPN